MEYLYLAIGAVIVAYMFRSTLSDLVDSVGYLKQIVLALFRLVTPGKIGDHYTNYPWRYASTNPKKTFRVTRDST